MLDRHRDTICKQRLKKYEMCNSKMNFDASKKLNPETYARENLINMTHKCRPKRGHEITKVR